MHLLLILLVSLTFSVVGQQSPSTDAAQPVSCKFSISDTEPAKPIITGPDDVVKLVHVIEQRDSPVEILSADFTGTAVSISGGRQNHKDCWTIKVRNRSDHLISDLIVTTAFTDRTRGFSGISPRNRQGLAPGQTVELRSCNSGGGGGAQNDQVRLIVGVEWVRFDNCEYFPSRRFPVSLGLRPYLALTGPR